MDAGSWMRMMTEHLHACVRAFDEGVELLMVMARRVVEIGTEGLWKLVRMVICM